MRRSVRLLAAAALTTAALTPTLPAQAAPSGADLSDHLAEELPTLGLLERTTVLVHGTDLAAADRAVARPA